MKKDSKNKIIIVTIFSIAMAFIEATVVIYLRKIFYPNGFLFPLVGFIDPEILAIEWIREAATIIMLITIGLLAANTFYKKFAFFIYSFAVWDIFYYIFLKLTLNWPSSIFTWDLLFLIPWPWIGPVIAPVLCAILMIITAFLLINLEDKGNKIKLKIQDILIILFGVLIVLFTWLIDYGKIIIGQGFLLDFFSLSKNSKFIETVNNFIPRDYDYVLFSLGLLISFFWIIKTYKKNKVK